MKYLGYLLNRNTFDFEINKSLEQISELNSSFSISLIKEKE